MIWLLTSVCGYSFAMLVVGLLISLSLARPVMPRGLKVSGSRAQPVASRDPSGISVG